MSYSCGAVIVETRQIPNLEEIIDNHVKFLPKNWGLMVIKDVVVHSLSDYNRLMTSKAFWDNLPYDKILVFQSDSMLLRTGIEEFLEYDFIGAPLYHIDFPAMNGGLSLRSKKAMLEVIEKIQYTGGNEDVFFCNGIKELKGKLPTKEVAQKFSVETIFGYGSLGVHALEKWHTPEQCELILNQYT